MLRGDEPGAQQAVDVRRSIHLLSRFEHLSDRESAELAEAISGSGSLSGLLAEASRQTGPGALSAEQMRFVRLYRLLLRLLAFEPELSGLYGKDISEQLDSAGIHLSSGDSDSAEQTLSLLWSGLVAAVEDLPAGPGGLLALGLEDLVADLRVTGHRARP